MVKKVAFPVGTQLYLREEYSPKLHPEIEEKIILNQGSHATVHGVEKDGSINVVFGAFHLNRTFRPEEIGELFTTIWIPEFHPIDPGSEAAQQKK